jgi:RNA polymerase sigma factor (sigma-70 family)
MVGDPDTDIGGPAWRFPPTRRSVILATTSEDPEARSRAFATIIAAYWKPVYKYIRLRWRASNEDAKDLTQEFFTRVMEKGYFDRYTPDRARFRTFLRTCLDGFLSNEHKATRRLKRGGGLEPVSLDFEGAEAELARAGVAEGPEPDLDAVFHREWLRSLFSLAVRDLEASCVASGKQVHFALFERYDLRAADGAERPTYQQVGRDLGVSVTQVTNYLAAVRREFRRILLERLRELCATDEEYRAEAEELFGARPG